MLKAGTNTIALQHEGRERPYDLHVPPSGLDLQTPRVLQIHGRGINPELSDRNSVQSVAEGAGTLAAELAASDESVSCLMKGGSVSPADLLVEAFSRIQHIVHRAVEGLTPDQLAFRLDGEANSIAWLVWHLTRIQDHHVAEAAGAEEVWTSDGWKARFALPLPASDTGYGHSSNDVAAVQIESPELLTGYHDAVYEHTLRYVKGLSQPDLERIIDESWDPPVSLGVRLVSVIADDLQHAGQAAFVRGILSQR